MRITLTTLSFCLAAACATPARAAGPVQLQVAPADALAPVNPDVLRGFNFGNWMQAGEFQRQLLTIRPAQFRFPGGNVGDEYDMTEDIIKVFKVNLQVMRQPRVTFHTRVFQARGVNDPPARNTPADAAASVRMARAHGLKVPYWEVGNEPDLFAVTRGDKSWTAERYCEVFRAQAAAIRKADPGALLAGPAVSGSVPVRDRFLETFVKECGDVVDVVTYHIYPTDGGADDDKALDTAAEADEVIRRYRALWADPVRNPRGHARKVRWGVTEYGLSWKTDNPHHLADMVGALWAAEVALRLNRNQVDVAHYFAFQATGGHGLLDTAGVPRPTYYAFRMLAGLKGRLVAARSSDPGVWVHAVRDGRRVTLLLLNRSAQPRTVDTALPGLRLRGGDSFDARVVDEELENTRVAPAAAVTLTPRSMTRLVFDLL